MTKFIRWDGTYWSQAIGYDEILCKSLIFKQCRYEGIGSMNIVFLLEDGTERILRPGDWIIIKNGKFFQNFKYLNLYQG